MKITLLADLQEIPGFCGEFGLSLLLEKSGIKLLFDTGSGNAFVENCRKLDVDLSDCSGLILSHGHYDHTGGLAYLPQPQMIYACKGVAQGHYSKHADGNVHHISMPEDSRKVLLDNPVTFIDNFTEIFPGIFLSGPVPRVSGEDCGGNFFHDAPCTISDTVPEEQFLLTSDGILITGCCHAGIINTLEYCRIMHPEISVHTVVGGLHLRRAEPERLQKTAEYLKVSSVKELYIGHCTGENAVEFLQKALPDRKVISPVLGSTWEINQLF